jgi:hypothetical protein
VRSFVAAPRHCRLCCCGADLSRNTDCWQLTLHVLTPVLCLLCCVSFCVPVSFMACPQLTSEAEQERAKSADTIDTLRSARDEVHNLHA